MLLRELDRRASSRAWRTGWRRSCSRSVPGAPPPRPGWRRGRHRHPAAVPAGLALDGVGFVGNVVALRELPLFLVEAIVAGSVGVTAVIAALRGERLRGRDWIALGVLGARAGAAERQCRAGGGVRDLHAPATGSSSAARCCRWSSAWSATDCRVVLGRAARRGRRPGLQRGRRRVPRRWAPTAIDLGLSANPLLWAIVVVRSVWRSGSSASPCSAGRSPSVAAVTFVIEVVVPSALGLLLFGDSIARRHVGPSRSPVSCWRSAAPSR